MGGKTSGPVETKQASGSDGEVRTADQPTVEPDRPTRPGPTAGEPCAVCGAELAVIQMTVDGNDLIMESCDRCDVRRWQLAGERIDLPQVLSEFGEHAGRRR